MDMKRFFLYAIVIAALALAGCGSDGNGGMTAMPDPAPDPDPMPTAIDLSSLTAGMMLGAAGAQTIQPGMTYESGQVMFTCPAGGSACMVTVNANGTATYDANGGMPTVANTQAAIDRMDAMVAAATKAAGTKLTAIMAEAAQGPGQNPANNDAGLGGSDALGSDGQTGTEDDPYKLAITRDRMATKVTITDSTPAFDGLDDDNNTMRDDDEPQFEKAMDMGMANGFAGSMHVRVNSDDDDDGKVEEVVVVRTDIDAPKATPFAEVTNEDTTLSQALTVRKDGGSITDADPADSILVQAGTGNANLPKIMSAAFAAPSDGGATTVHTFLPAATGDTPRDAAEVMGTYNGAMGTYTCGGSADCTVTVNGEGEVTTIAGGWTFTPNEGATSDVADTSYLAYGFWLKRTTKDGETTYNEVEAFTGGNVPQTVAANLANVAGTATYMGNSTGVYVKNVTDSQGAITSATSGVYSADVTLNASFGGGKIGVDDQFRIDGEVTDFALEHGEENDWMVKLESADFSGVANRGPDTPAGSSHTNVFSSTTIGDSAADKGSWNGGFYGVATEITEDETPRNAPPHVLGEFNANFTDGAVLGAFGADKMEDSQ